MFKKLSLVAAAGAGYVLGTRAGKERYAQIERKARSLAGKPAVQNATDAVLQKAEAVKDSAAATVQDAKQTLNETVENAVGGAGGTEAPVVDLTSTSANSPRAGAAASSTAPDPV